MIAVLLLYTFRSEEQGTVKYFPCKRVRVREQQQEGEGARATTGSDNRIGEVWRVTTTQHAAGKKPAMTKEHGTLGQPASKPRVCKTWAYLKFVYDPALSQ
jgi:hypothetical protein